MATKKGGHQWLTPHEEREVLAGAFRPRSKSRCSWVWKVVRVGRDLATDFESGKAMKTKTSSCMNSSVLVRCVVI